MPSEVRILSRALMKGEKMLEAKEPMKKTKIIKRKIPEMREHSKICQELFPEQIHDPVLVGELLFIIRQGVSLECDKEEIKAAGNWWLWVRNLFIENTMSRQMKRVMAKIALNAARLNQPIHFVSTRSPELIHAQISTQGDARLPRSRKALGEFSNLVKKSSEFLRTKGTVLLADVAIDNLERILAVCPDLEKVIKENHQRLEEIAIEEGLPNLEIRRLSELPHPSGKKLGDLINRDGTVNIEIMFSSKAEMKITTASQESFQSHQRMFGWTKEQSEEHNRNLAKTMALVGQAVKMMQPEAILIHNEAFISRGVLNNLLTDPNDPLPVICLITLLENKKKRN